MRQVAPIRGHAIGTAHGAQRHGVGFSSSLADLVRTHAHLLGDAERRFCLSPGLHAEFFGDLRWTSDEARRTRDGLDLNTLELSPMDLAALQLARSPEVAQVLRMTDGGGSAVASRMIQGIRSAAAVAYLTVPTARPSGARPAGPDQASTTWVRGGRALQQVWLTASALGLAVQPCNNLLRLLGRVERFNGEGLKNDEISAVIDLRERLGQHFVGSLADADIAILRLAHSNDPPSERSRRLQLDAVLTIPDSSTP